MKKTIIEEAIYALNTASGRPIVDVIWDSPTLVIRGEGWRLTTLSGWRLMQGPAMIAGSDDDRARKFVEALRGAALASAVTTEPPVDPTLIFENGIRLEVFSSSLFEPWVVHVEGFPVFVAAPGDPFVSD